MKIKLFFLILISFWAMNILCLDVQAKSMLYDILDKGSTWTLVVDGEEGILELMGGRGSSTGGMGWRMSMDVRWQGRMGNLRAEADNENNQQRVFISLKRNDEMPVICEGYIAQESDRFMAGSTRYPSADKISYGAWYALKITAPAAGETPARPMLPNIPPIRQRDVTKDAEPPKVNISTDSILVFTVNDTIKLRADASDNIKVSQVSIFIDGQEKKTCYAWECRYSETLLKIGPHKCWAAAVDSSGNRGQSPILEFMVQPTAKPGPNLNTRTQPSMPTNQDKITFIADASHPSGVETISIFINGQLVKTCNQNHCEYTGGPYKEPEVLWRVSSQSFEGGITYGDEKSLSIFQVQSGTCAISGKVHGPGAKVANGFFIILYGPDNLTLYRGVESFNRDGIYSFTDLPPGKYKLAIDTKADIAIAPHPSSRVVECTAGPINNVDFELK